MEIEIIDLTERNLLDAPEWGTHPFSCKYCLYWEFPEVCVNSKDEMLDKKLWWLRNTGKIFGNCGKLLYVDGKAVGYAQYAPPEFLPNSYNYASGPPSRDAVLISCLTIPDRKFQRIGLGSMLLQSLIDDLKVRNTRAVETFARKGSTSNPSGPVEFYLRNRFRIHKDDEEFPLMRLEL